MIKADRYFRDNLKNILDNGNIDFGARPRYKSDNKEANSLFITQVFEEYDISKGEFPITTLRNTAIKCGINEVLTIFQNQENSQESFSLNSVDWWLDWMNEDGNIGRSYSHNIESHREGESNRDIVKVNRIIVDNKFSQIIDNSVGEIKDSLDGKIYNNRYIVIGDSEKIGNGKVKKYKKVQFIGSGYVSDMRVDQIGKSNGKDVYDRTTFGIGYIGEYSLPRIINENHKDILKDKWENMFRRCYSKNYMNRSHYKDMFVHNRWHSFANFLNDVCFIPQFHLAKEDNFIGWELDKDYFGSNSYSQKTCVFLKKSDNLIYSRSYPIKIIGNGINEVVINLSGFCRDNGLSQSKMHLSLTKGISYKGYSAERVCDDKHLYRYELSRNQLNELIINLKENPFGRRHIISFWNWANINKKELVECAYETLWSCRKVDGEMFLDMTLIQRSSDYIMAGYINKIQYVALQMMIAHHLGYKVGKFCHLVQNLHIYDRHIDAANEILKRDPRFST